jgi:penicillin-insensitive murein endopeptidase
MPPPRRSRLAPAVLLIAGLAAFEARAESAWSKLKTPGPGVAQSIGEPSAGCVAGAEPLPLEGRGYQVVGAQRHRSFGHPALIAYVEALGRALAEAGFARVYVGDLGQPRGGPMPGAHASHQTGLDVDVRFDLDAKPSAAARPRAPAAVQSLVLADNLEVDPARWRPEHAQLLALAAAPAGVDRIFVHPAIKRRLCRATEGDRAWLQKLRPWFGHDAHFHVRLRCPAGSAACVSGLPLPAGDGCDETLAWWFEPEDGVLPAWREVDPRPPSASGDRERPALPEACLALLRAR